VKDAVYGWALTIQKENTSMHRFARSIWLSLPALVLLWACAAQQPSPPTESIGRKIADAYGIQSFDRITALAFTFNAAIGEKHIQRSWIWWPKKKEVTFLGSGADDKATLYSRKDLDSGPDSQANKRIDALFINDQYWLLFPFHLVWDEEARIEDGGMHELPFGGGVGRRIIVSYPPVGGYTPGDVYELFIDDNDRIIQWVYRKGGSIDPTRETTWQDQRKVGPLMLSLDRHGRNGAFRVWFTQVSVQMAGSDAWMSSK
jgi:hypothetical protein